MDNNAPQCPACGAPLPMDLCPKCTLRALSGFKVSGEKTNGPTIPGLTVHEEIGEGGFGIVYRATQADLIQRTVALKVLKPGVDTRQVLRRFEVERQTLALLEHPNIARFYQAGETDKGYPWFTMELIEGEPISDAFAGKDLEFLIETYIHVCGAVAFAHEKGVIHRDLKPTNILVTAHGEAKIIDFGVAKATGPTPGMTLYTADEVTSGTPAYMAPEKGPDNDPRGDVYALGAVLFELLTETHPPESGDFPPPSTLAIRRISKSLDIIVAKAVKKDPDQRYQSARELATDLRRFQNGEDIKDKTPFLLSWGIGLCALILIGALAFWLPQPAPTGPTEEIIEQPVVVHHSKGHPAQIEISPDSTRALGVFRTNGRTILIDPRDGRELGSVPGRPNGVGAGSFTQDGKRFVLGHSNSKFRFYSSEDARPLSPFIDGEASNDWISHIRHLTIAGEAEPVVLTSTGPFLRAWKEDGTMRWQIPLIGPAYRLAINPRHDSAIIGSPRGELNLIDLVAATRKVVREQSAHIYEIKYSPDGSLFACASFDHSVTVWKASGDLVFHFKLGNKVKDLDFSPDGKFLAAPSFDGTVRLWNLENGKEIHRFHHHGDALAVCFTPDGQTLASGGRDHMLRLWNLSTGKPLAPPHPCGGAVDRIRIWQGASEDLRMIVQTWNEELLVIPMSQIAK